jgi:FkbM family methyltransferase
MIDYKKEIFDCIDTNIIQTNKEFEEFCNKVNKAKQICLFGAALNGQSLAYYLNSNQITTNFFCDNNSNIWNKNICLNIPCISPDKIRNINNEELYIIISSRYYIEIINQLDILGFSNYSVFPSYLYLKVKNYLLSIDKIKLKNNISKLIDILGDESSKITLASIIINWFSSINNFVDKKNWKKTDEVQYFPRKIIKLTEDEVLIDIGAFDGDTIKLFLNETCGKFNKIISYELDKKNYLILLENINKYGPKIKNKIISYNLGVLNENKLINYFSGSTSAIIDSDSNETGNVIKLSEHLTNVLPTYIKMDIEGAELEALTGAEEIIKKYKPKLAICVYHKPEHLWEIPFYLKKIVPEYNIYLRHHSFDITETVCYAVIE